MAQQRQRTSDRQEDTVRREISHSDEQISFNSAGFKGILVVNGVPQQPHKVLNCRSSNGLTQHTAIEWIDSATGTLRTSCNCTGWTIKKANKPRTCKHTEALISGDYSGIDLYDEEIPATEIHSVEEAEAVIPEKAVPRRSLRSLNFD